MFSGLDRKQKEAVGLLSIGTFLEYFDLMLYVHMAVLLNELFFPKTDPFTASLLSAFAFCSIFVFRPIGALLFGYLGDHIGRKAIVVLTTTMMSLSCITMAILPTYAQIGITASWIIVVCRIVQGMSSVGEIIGAEIYLTESMPHDYKSSSIGLLGAFSVLGATFALGVASLVFLMKLEWRFAFGIGALIALVGGVARTTLKETQDFVDAKQRVKKVLNQFTGKVDENILKNNLFFNEKPKIKTTISLFLMDCSWPVCFYVGYIYSGDILKTYFGYSAEQVIRHNFFVSISELLMFLVLIFLAKRVPILKFLRVVSILFFVFIIYCAYSFNDLTDPYQLFLVQSIIVAYGPIIMIGVPIFFSYFQVFKRFTYVIIVHSLSRAIIYVLTSVGLI